MYIGSFVADREYYIENGEPEDNPMTEKQKTLKCEQSDQVLILMNLAIIPDSVVKKINFVPGWQAEFKNNMLAYKEEFCANHSREWKYQDDDLEQEYRIFVKVQELKDPFYEECIYRGNEDTMGTGKEGEYNRIE